MRKTKWQLNNFTKPKAVKPPKPVTTYNLPVTKNMDEYKTQCERSKKRVSELNPFI